MELRRIDMNYLPCLFIYVRQRGNKDIQFLIMGNFAYLHPRKYETEFFRLKNI